MPSDTCLSRYALVIVRVYMPACIHVRLIVGNINEYVCVCVCVCMFLLLFMYLCMHACTQVRLLSGNINAYTYIYIYIYMHTYDLVMYHVCVYACMFCKANCSKHECYIF